MTSKPDVDDYQRDRIEVLKAFWHLRDLLARIRPGEWPAFEESQQSNGSTHLTASVLLPSYVVHNARKPGAEPEEER